MRNVFLRLRYLDTWSSVGDAVSEALEHLEAKPYQRMYSTGCELGEVMVSPLLLIFSLMSEVRQNVSASSSLDLLLHLTCHSPPGTINPNNRSS